MGAANGSVVGITKIFDSGLPSERWNLIIVAEGYTSAEQAQFQTDAQELADHLFTTSPFDEDEVACAINVYRLDVISDESGADDPDCDNDGASASTVDTYFDATFCSNGSVQRLLSGDSSLAQTAVEDVFSQWHQIVVLVNSSQRGGAGGSVAWLSTGGSDWRDVFIHELGHSAFGLADEYDCYVCDADEDDRDNYPGGEPAEPNVTAEPDPALVKWNSFVTAGSDVPTLANPDCGERNTSPNPGGATTVGTFEGAFYYHCGAYRPQYECKMQRSAFPTFCVVCTDTIRSFYASYALPAVTGSVLLSTPTVTFNDIPEDVTTERAATFTVDSCVPVTFQVTSAPAAPFEAVSPGATVAYPSGPTPWNAFVRFRYSCDMAGASHNDQAIILCIETGESFDVNLSANCVTRPTVAVQLVFDQSGSMLDMTDEGRTKEQVLKDAATAFAEILYDDNGVGLNAYDQDPQPILNVQQAGAPGDGLGRDDVSSEIVGFSANPAGLTAIGDGIELAKNRLDSVSGYSQKAMIVLTDGIETADKRVSDVADSVVNQQVFAIGLGTGSQIQPTTLEALTGSTKGYLLMTGNLSETDTFLLSKYYLQILAGVNNNDIIVDPEGFVRDTAVRIPFDVTDSDIEITGVVLSVAPEALSFALESPEGQIIDNSVASADPTVSYRLGEQTVFIRASLPQFIGTEIARSGRWHLLLKLDSKSFRRYLSILKNLAAEDQTGRYIKLLETAQAHGIKYSANVYTYSNLRLRARVLQDSYEPGSTLTLRADLSEYGVPFGGYASVRAELLHPDGSSQTLTFAGMQGSHETELIANQAGVYRFRVIANGRTTREQQFTREQIVTASVWQGGDSPTIPPRSSDDLCQLLTCLLKGGALRDEGRKRLEEFGIDVARLYECLCEDDQRSLKDTLVVNHVSELQDQLRRALEMTKTFENQ